MHDDDDSGVDTISFCLAAHHDAEPIVLTRLDQRTVRKPWGRQDLPEMYAAPADGQPLGEIWFTRENGGADPLLVKYLFTSEKLSVQVHPDDAAARREGLGRGKDEAWVIVAALPDAKVGLGLTEDLSKERIGRASRDGSIEDLLDWRSVAAGDAFYCPGGTLHSLGAGLTLVEVQQNADVTFRLYDFGRGRDLQLDRALSVVNPRSSPTKSREQPLDDHRSIVVGGPALTIERLTGYTEVSLPADPTRPLWLIPIRGTASVARETLEAPGVWIAEELVELVVEAGSELLLAYEGDAAPF